MNKTQTVTLGLSSVIRPPGSNPRTQFNEEALGELTESVKRHGVLQPILVRPLEEGRYELVAGERRLRASEAAGLTVIPVMVRDLSDREVLEVQVIENLLREDLHPLEEAEAYRKLCSDHSCAVGDLVLKIGKSRSYVYARMKLCDLPDVAKEAMWKGGLSHSTALLIARIPDPELRKRATQELVEGDWRGGPPSYREARTLIQGNYMLRLSSAEFPTEDSELLPEAGSCADCPKRTGNQRDLFPDIKSADVCTDPPCFKDKQDAHWERTKLQAKADGKKILSDAKASKVVPYGYVSVRKYLKLTDCNYDAPKHETYKELLGKEAPQIFLARDKQNRVHDLVFRREARALIEEKYEWAKLGASLTDRREQADKLEKLVKRRMIDGLVAAIPGVKTGKEFWKILALCAVERAWSEIVIQVVRRRKLEVKKRKHTGLDYKGALLKAIKSMTLGELRTVVVALLTIPEIDSYDKSRRIRVEKFLGVNRSAITRKAKGELKGSFGYGKHQ